LRHLYLKDLNSKGVILFMEQTRKQEMKNAVLGKKVTKFVFDKPSARILETFRNRYAKRDYVINIDIPEFTSICPLTGQPDFAIIHIRYIPDKKCIESKSLKLYIFSYRNFPEFHEDCVNRILEDCIKACKPRWVQVIGKFNARGGITITPITEYKRPGYKLPEEALRRTDPIINI
jgi:7-cyano-7-deazaguanine reductase